MNIGTINPNPGTIPSATVLLPGGVTPPSFITYVAPIVTFNSPGYAQIADYNLEIKV